MRKFINKDLQINADEYIGKTGELWVSEDNSTLRVGDNTTPGGVEIGVGSASKLSNGSAEVTLGPDGLLNLTPGGELRITNPVVPEAVFDVPGTHQWTCPEGVTSVCVVAVGGGAGGSDTSGDGSQGGGDSWFISPSTVAGLGAPGYTGDNGGIGGGYVGDGGGNGGRSGNAMPSSYPVGGGGAGGYLGNGGDGADYNGSGTAGDGGGGGSGGGEFENTGGGGGVGLYGIGQSGAAGTYSDNQYTNFFGAGGGGGSGGEGGGSGSGIGYCEGGGGGGLGWKNSIAVVPGQTYTVQVGAGGTALNENNNNAGNGGHGAVRIIWGGSSENDFSFPFNAGYSLTLDQNGITFPLGGTITTNIVEPQNIGPVPTIDIRPYSIDPNQLLRIYPTVTEGNHLHLTSGNLKVTDIYLGDDMQYVRTGADGRVAIGTNGGEVWGGNTWLFDTSGVTTFPSLTLSPTNQDTPISIGWGTREGGGNQAINIGTFAGVSDQGQKSIAIGSESGRVQQGTFSIAIGRYSGYTYQHNYTIAIGDSAGFNNQGESSIAAGSGAGYESQGIEAIAIGPNAGSSHQGNCSIAVGRSAGVTSQADNSIVINATGNTLDNNTPNSVVIKPMRRVTSTAGLYPIYYDPTTGEMVYYQP